MAQKEIRKTRIKKLKKIEKSGINSYPSSFEKPKKIKNVLSAFKNGKRVIVAGRIRTLRLHGGSLFLDIDDSTGMIQLFLRKNILKERYVFFKENIDIGDFILFKGKLFITKKREKTVDVLDYKILSKSLLPLPEKWHGLKDIEERFRKRYLDLIMSREVKEKFILRSKIIFEIRKFLDKKGFLEVETPVLQTIYGGASAEPFRTHHRVFDLDLFLRIAPELYLKRLLVGGFDKVYEIGRVFRNEGIDRFHNPEFTTLEFYWAYTNLEEMMKFCETMIKEVVKKVLKKDKIICQGKEIDFSKPFKRVYFYQLIESKIKKDPRKLKDKDIIKIAKNLKVPTLNKTRFKLLDDIFKKVCKEKIFQPTFVLYSPIELTPLAKSKEDDSSLASRFQLVIGDWETMNAFSELNNPIEQRKRFEYQRKEKKKGDKEAHPFDEDFIEALEYGMPPAVGCGMGIDRLVALITNSKSIKEVILFPLMRSLD